MVLPPDIPDGYIAGSVWLNKVKNAIPQQVSKQPIDKYNRRDLSQVVFWAVITSAVEQTGNTWHYGYRQADQLRDGTWQSSPYGYYGNGSDETHARNSFEAINAVAGENGTLGNGLIFNDLSPGQEIQPISIGNPVRMSFVPIVDGDVDDGYYGYRATFSASNAAGGECV